MQGDTVPVRDLRLKITLPTCTTYAPGSSRSDGTIIPDPEQGPDALIIFRLADMPADWTRSISFSATTTPDCKKGEISTRAYLAYTTSTGSQRLTAPAITTLEKTTSEQVHRLPEIVVRPQFSSFGAELGPQDRERLDELARLLKVLRTQKIDLVGHTDNVPISHRQQAHLHRQYHAFIGSSPKRRTLPDGRTRLAARKDIH